jgi:hypothetical protein
MKNKSFKIFATLTLLFIGSAFSNVSAQKIEVTGNVIDKTTSTTLPGATVMILYPKDSTFYKFGTTNSEGSFNIKGIESGDYLLQISFIGYNSYFKSLELNPTTPLLNLGTLDLETKKELLKSVEVVEEMVPVIINGDTVEYNAAAFKTQPEANVSDLLRKLPGLEVEKDGTVKAQGEEVKKVLIDGKEFFGNDTKLATENLPADMVKSVQVYDDQSDASKITGIDDGDRTKTINLKIKKDRKKGVFGNVTAGGGSTANGTGNIEDENGIYNGKFNINKFTNKMQLSTLGMLNNNNEQGFSYQDYLNFAGGASNAMKGGGGFRSAGNNSLGVSVGGNSNDGFTETNAAGINLNYQFTPAINFSSSYFYNQSDKDILSTTDRQYIADSNQYNSFLKDIENQLNKNHRINLKWEQKIDSTQDLTIKTNLTYSDGSANSISTNENVSIENTFLNSSDNTIQSEGTDLGINANLTYGKRFKKKGRSFVSRLTFGNSNNEKNYIIKSISTFPNSFINTINQTQNEINKQIDYSGKVTITEPIAKQTYLELSYKRSNFNNDYIKEFYDISGNNNEVFNSALSLNYDNSFIYDNFGLGAKLNGEKSNITLATSFQRSDLNGEIIANNYKLKRVEWNLLPNLKWNYRFTNTTRLTFDYNTSVQNPSITQLQPTLDNSDPLNLYQGSPNLINEYTHSARMRLMSFNRFSFTNIFAMLNSTYTKNKITNSQFLDSNFVQTITPINVDYDYMLTGYLYFGTPIRPLKSKIGTRVSSSYNRSILFVNTLENNVNRYTNSIDFSIENRKKDFFDGKIGAKISLNTTKYSVNRSLNQNYLSSLYYAELLINLSKTWTISTEIDYTTYSSDQFIDNPDIPIMQAYISKRFLKGNSGLLKLAVYDIFNQNVGINRTSQSNFIEDQRVSTLSRYVMLSFTYKIRRFGGKKKKNQKSEV